MAKIILLSPFGKPFDEYFRDILKPGLKKYGHDLFRADDVHTPRVILQIIKNNFI